MLRINGKSMAVKDIRTKIKYGATPQDFAEFFEATEQEFMVNLQKRLKDVYPEYERELRKNKKKRAQSLRKKSTTTVVCEEKGREEVVDEAVDISETETPNTEESLREKLFIIQSSMEKEQERYRNSLGLTARYLYDTYGKI